MHFNFGFLQLVSLEIIKKVLTKKPSVDCDTCLQNNKKIVNKSLGHQNFKILALILQENDLFYGIIT